ncbi:WD40-repeat-containing domain protein, partial [Halteromyces radiatus]|uniref:WD40-repeat-containing domain protein n=1 Tax=Halteromyces radiatus TaxID=101107 RepID=UPI002220D569
RAVAWHPHHELLAIAREDHHVYIYERDSQRNTWRTQVLEHHYMANITSLEWKKYSHGTLAVGCQAGVCVWFLTDSRCANRDNRTLSNAYMHFFSTPGHRHISSVAWDPSPGSQVLAAASGVDSTLIMYDIMTFNHTPVKRYGKGNTLLSWSPDGKYLYVANLNGKSRLWETRNWTNTEIRNPPGLWVKSACWAPDSCSLFYSMVGKQDIHALCLPTSKSTASGMWDIKILEIPPAEVTMSNEQKVPIGGVIKELALDPNNGCRLAVSFEHCNYVALYKVMPLKQPMSLSQGQELTLM